METEETSFICQIGVGPVFLTVTIGEGQTGVTSVLHGDDRLIRGSSVIAGLSVGEGEGLIDDEISIHSIVNDVSTQTDTMSVRYVIANGGHRKSFLAKHGVQTEGATCRFVSTIAFAR
jgi:hypothetical protein